MPTSFCRRATLTFCMTVRCRLPSAQRHRSTVMQMLRWSLVFLEQDKGCCISLAVLCLSVPCQGASGCHRSPRPPPTPFPPIKTILTFVLLSSLQVTFGSRYRKSQLRQFPFSPDSLSSTLNPFRPIFGRFQSASVSFNHFQSV